MAWAFSDFALIGSVSLLRLHEVRIYLDLTLRAYPGTTNARARLPFHVTPLLTYYTLGR